MSDRRRNQPGEPRPLFDEASERAMLGCCLQDSAKFWESFNRVKAEDFSSARLSRIWQAMCRCAEKGKPVNQNWISLMIDPQDAKEDTPLKVFMAVLFNDAPPSGDFDAYVDNVLHFANKRALIDQLDRAKAEILSADVGVPAEHMKDLGIRRISNAFNGETDEDLMEYQAWGAKFAARAQANYDLGDDAHIGLGSGLRAVDQVIGRLLPGKLIVLAGMSSSGKSALARQIMQAASQDAARSKLGYGYIASLEMTGEEYAIRAISPMTGIASDRLEAGDLNSGELDIIKRKVADLAKYPIYVDQRPRMTSEQIRARALKIKNTKGLAIMAIDHLLLVRGAGRADGIHDRVSEATIEAKNLAKELGIPVIMLAQINEKKLLESTTKWPNSSMLFGGESIMQNADIVFFVHRPEVVLQKNEPSQNAQPKEPKEGEKPKRTPWEQWNDRMEAVRGKAWVFNNKRRGGAPAVKMEMNFHGPTMTFSDI